MDLISLQTDQLLYLYLAEEEEEQDLIQRQCPKVADTVLQIGCQVNQLLIGHMEAAELMAVMEAMALIIKQVFYFLALLVAADHTKLIRQLELVAMVDMVLVAAAVLLQIMVLQVVLVEMVAVV